jgi:glucokinase
VSGIAVVAVDLGGSSMKGAVVNADGKAAITLSRPTPVPGALAAVVALARDLLEAATAAGYQVIASAAVTPGMVDEGAGIVGYAANLGWRGVHLRDELAARLGIPVAVGHDVRAAGRAERLIGAGSGYDDILFVQIGTGVAAVQISDGHIIVGVDGAAGEFGHIPLLRNGELCTCGQFGCLEVYVSGAGLARRYLAAGGTARSAGEISARIGVDVVADRVWKDAVDALAQGLVTMTLLMDPGLIIIGGGFTNAGDALLVPLAAAIRTGLAWRAAAPLVLSRLGDTAGVMGAAVLAFQTAGRPEVVAGWGVRRVDSPVG